MSKYTYNFGYNFTCEFFCPSQEIKYVDNNRKVCAKNLVVNVGLGVIILAQFFTKLSSNVMYISINKQVWSFQNIFGLLCGLSQGKDSKNFPLFQYFCV